MNRTAASMVQPRNVYLRAHRAASLLEGGRCTPARAATRVHDVMDPVYKEEWPQCSFAWAEQLIEEARS